MLIPLKQGLKPSKNTRTDHQEGIVEMLIPLKQGLKQVIHEGTDLKANVEMLIPLKQGLKHEEKVTWVKSDEKSKC